MKTISILGKNYISDFDCSHVRMKTLREKTGIGVYVYAGKAWKSPKKVILYEQHGFKSFKRARQFVQPILDETRAKWVVPKEQAKQRQALEQQIKAQQKAQLVESIEQEISAYPLSDLSQVYLATKNNVIGSALSKRLTTLFNLIASEARSLGHPSMQALKQGLIKLGGRSDLRQIAATGKLDDLENHYQALAHTIPITIEAPWAL